MPDTRQTSLSRRQFSRTMAGTALGLGELSGWLASHSLSADDAPVTPDLVRFGPDIEPIVKLIEQTPREECIAVMAAQLRRGLPYRHFLAALYLAARTRMPHEAARLSFAFGERFPAEGLLNAARRLIPAKCSGDPHDLKFPVAIFEDLGLVSPAWRPHLLAAAAFSFWGSERPDLPNVQQVREALGKP